MFKLITEKIAASEYNQLIKNFFSLSILQGANYILPLIIQPYLARVLGIENFGLISFSWAFVNYFMIITDFGFLLYATKEIASYHLNTQKINDLFNTVYIIKICLLILSSTILLGIVFTFDNFYEHWEIYVLSFGRVIGFTLFPLWFFLGLEHMKHITILNISNKLSFLLLIVLMVHSADQILWVAALDSISYVSIGIIGIAIAIRKFKIKFYLPDLKFIQYTIKKSFQYWISRLSISIYTSSNTFLLGIVTNNQSVGMYAAMEKLYLAAQGMYQPVVNTLFPYMSRKRNKKLFKKLFWFLLISNSAIALFIIVLSPEIIRFIFGTEYLSGTPVLRIFGTALILIVPSILLGYPFLAVFKEEYIANLSVVLGSFLHLSLWFVLILMKEVSLIKIASLVLFTEAIVLLIRLTRLVQKKLWVDE